MKIRYYGHVGQRTGYGIAATQMCAALIRAGADVEIRTMDAGIAVKRTADGPNPFELDLPLPVAKAIRRDHELDKKPDVVIVHTLPVDCNRVLALVGEEMTLGEGHRPKLVAYTTWEGLTAPRELVDRLAVFDQVWVPSSANLSAFVCNDNPFMAERIRVVPHAFDEDSLEDRRRKVDPSELFTFYYVGAWSTRKNPAGVIRAYCHAFGPKDPVRLFLQCSGAAESDLGPVLGSTGLSSEEAPIILPHTRPLSDDQVLDLHRTFDVFVTASHGEAWNLPAFDAMLAGRHVIAPEGHGSDDFLGNTSASRYRATAGIAHRDVLVRAQDGKRFDITVKGAQGLSSKCLWLEPDLYYLSRQMRRAFEERRNTIDVHYDPREKFGYAAVGKLALANLQEIR